MDTVEEKINRTVVALCDVIQSLAQQGTESSHVILIDLVQSAAEFIKASKI
jgi:hypothetical protein